MPINKSIQIFKKVDKDKNKNEAEQSEEEILHKVFKDVSVNKLHVQI